MAKNIGGHALLVAVVSFLLVSSTGFVDCRKSFETFFNHNKAVLKTIKGDGGDVIDCVDIYKQPSLNHPLLKNHVIQLKPSLYPSETAKESAGSDVFQTWRANGECPDGTVPIVRTRKFNHLPSKQILPQFNRSHEVNEFNDDPSAHEYASVRATGDPYYGASASFNVWEPATYNNDMSVAQIWVYAANQGSSLSSVEAGWINYQLLDKRSTTFFTFWTGDGYNSTGCYNLECPGFIMISKKFAVGVPIEPVSTYNGEQYEIHIKVYKNVESGHWWLQVGDEPVGYWPDSIVPSLKGSASTVSWGGEIYNSNPEGHHTSTQMGSGHFPNEGWGRSSFVRHLKYADIDLTFRDPENLLTSVTRPGCYDLIIPEKNPEMETHFYFGGPGLSPTCP